MKIAILAPSLAESGGVRSVVKFLVDNMAQKPEYQVELISVATSFRDVHSRRILNPATWFRKPEAVKQELWGLPLWRVGTNWSELEFLRYRGHEGLKDLVHQYDLVQIVCGIPAWGNLARGWDLPCAMQVATLAKWERGAGSGSGGRWPLSLWRKVMTAITDRLDIRGVGYVDFVFYENDRFGAWLNTQVPEDNTLFAAPGIDTEVFKKTVQPLETLPSESYILNVGRLNDRRKDRLTLLRAYQELLAKVSDPPSLVIAGRNDPNQDYVQLVADLNLDNRVRILSDVSYDELIRLYLHAQLFVLSSREEGLGIVIMEAMSAALPIVTTDCGGPSSLLKEGVQGFFVPVGGHTQMADRMATLLLDERLRTQMSDASLAMSRNFDNSVRFAPFADVYAKLSKVSI